MKMEVKKQEYKKEQGKGLGEAEKNSRSSLSSGFIFVIYFYYLSTARNRRQLLSNGNKASSFGASMSLYIDTCLFLL